MFIYIIKLGVKAIKIRVQTMHHNYFRGGFFTIMRTIKVTKKGAKEMHSYVHCCNKAEKNQVKVN